MPGKCTNSSGNIFPGPCHKGPGKAPPPEGNIILAIGALPFKPLGSVPLTVWGIGANGAERTYACPGVLVEGPCRETTKKAVCQVVDNFFDLLEGAATHDIPGVRPLRSFKPIPDREVSHVVRKE